MSNKFYIRCTKVNDDEKFTEGKLYVADSSRTGISMLFTDDEGGEIFMVKPWRGSSAWKSTFRLVAKPVGGNND